MKQYIKENIDKLNEYCNENDLSLIKIMKSPKCYNHDIMFIQHVDRSKAGEGLKNNEPAKILLTIKRTSEGIKFEPSEDIKEYLS